MKKLLLSVAAVTAAVSSWAVTPEFQWAKALQSDGTTQIDQVVGAGEGNFYAVAHVKMGDVKWGGESLALTFNNPGSDTNDPLTILKLDSKGDLIWKVYAQDGDFTGLKTLPGAKTPDGGLVVASKVRTFKSMSSTSDNVATLVDATGKTVAIPNPDKSGWNYYGVVIKISADGAIEWTSPITPTFDYNGTATIDALDINGITTLADGTTVIAGTYKTAMTAGTVTLAAPVNVNAKGASTGDAFLMTFDPQGNCTKALRSDNTASAFATEQFHLAATDGTAVYVAGLLKANAAGAEFAFGGKSATVATTLTTPVVLKLTSSALETESIYTIEPAANEKKSNVVQLKYIDVNDGYLCISGAVNGSLSIDGVQVNSPALENGTFKNGLSGFTMIASTSDLKTFEGVCWNNTISSNVYTFIDPKTKSLYTATYNMNNAPVGVFLNQYPIANGSPEATGSFTISNATICFPGCFDDNTSSLVMNIRANSSCTLLGNADPLSLSAFSGVLASYKLEGVTSGIADVTLGGETPSVKVMAVTGGIAVEADENVTVAVYNLTGSLVATIAAGSSAQLPAGLYVTPYGKVLVK